MAWNVVFGYRMRFDTSAGKGDILINHVDASGQVQTTPLAGLPADRFGAIATLLTADKDHKIIFDGTVLDAGPEKP
jgi:hypothetical protein